jgi:integrase/recombinase XerD
MSSLRQQFIQHLELKGLSQKTVQNYTHVVIKLSQYYKVSPVELSTQQIKDYFHHLIKNKVLSEKSINNHIGALKTFYKFALPDSDIMKAFPSMKEPVTLPVVLTKSEMINLLSAPTNIKHKSILVILYATGIRLQECCDLELCDIKREEMLLHVKSGKGKKERYTILSKNLLEILAAYYTACRPKKYLFEGIYGKKYSKRSVEKIVTAATQKAGIKKKYHHIH